MKNKKKVTLLMGVLLLLSILLIGITWEPKLTVIPEVVVELGDPLPEANVFFVEAVENAEYQTDLSEIDTNTLKTNFVSLKVGRRTYESSIIVIDTTPPTGETKDFEIWLGEGSANLEDFLVAFDDLTDVVAAFKNAPNLEQAGEQEVVVVLTDTSGNTTELTSVLTIFEDTEPPVIEGVKNIRIYLGDNIAYRKDITVTDNHDETIDFEVDSSDVDLKKIGTYTVVYTAVDRAGNETSETASVIIEQKPLGNITQEMVDKKADAVLAKIITDDMSKLEKLRAAYNWTNKNVKYVGYSDKSSWLKGAYQGFAYGTGDCFNYYAVSRALISRLGYEFIPIKRVPAPTRHYWLLVEYEGQWYHFDPTVRSRGYEFSGFMRTQPDVEAYTELLANRVPSFYVYDPTGLPEVATEPLE